MPHRIEMLQDTSIIRHSVIPCKTPKALVNLTYFIDEASILSTCHFKSDSHESNASNI